MKADSFLPLPAGGGGPSRSDGGGARNEVEGFPPLRGDPSTAFGGPPPRDKLGEDFCVAAGRLAGLAGVRFGWTPETFWNATPAELAALARALGGGEPEPAGTGDLARLMEQFPDG